MTGASVRTADPLHVQSLREICATTPLLSMATVSPEGHPHINTAFFALAEDHTVYVLTPTHTEHAQHLRANPRAALAVYDSNQSHERRRGAQLFGSMAEVADSASERAFECFRMRFPDVGREGETYADFAQHHSARLFAFRADRAKLFDEALLDTGDYVEVVL